MSEERKILRFGAESRSALEQLGLNWSAIESTFLRWDASTIDAPMLPGCPKSARQYQTRERRALEQSTLAIRSRSFPIPNPWTGDVHSSHVTCTFTNRETLEKYFFVPLVYGFTFDGRSYWAVSCDLTGRIIHLFIPSLNLVIYELNLGRARALDADITESLSAFEDCMCSFSPQKPHAVIGVLDMVTNYGHQMINHLSGLELLIDEGCHLCPDEYWVCGRNFFGPIEDLFPEIGEKVRYFKSKTELAEKIASEKVLAVRVGSNCFYQKTRARILKVTSLRFSYPRNYDRYPLIAVTVRTAGRTCSNLGELIRETYERLLPLFPNVGFVIDGWVFGESEIIDHSAVATSLDKKYSTRISDELAAARSAFQFIPGTAVVRNLIGTSILQSIAGLQDIDAYIAHVGTLQHKIAFFSLKRGLVHGPTVQLTSLDSGAFQAELGHGPLYPDPSMVTDTGSEEGRGPSFSNYEISDVKGLVGSLLPLIHETASP
jgi:hypothetical protein